MVRTQCKGFNFSNLFFFANNFENNVYKFFNWGGRVEMSMSTLSGHKSWYQIRYFPDKYSR